MNEAAARIEQQAMAATIHAIHTVKGVPMSNLVPRALLFEFELDSMDMIEVGMIIEEQLGVQIPDDCFSDLVFLEDIPKVVGRLHLGGRSAASDVD